MVCAPQGARDAPRKGGGEKRTLPRKSQQPGSPSGGGGAAAAAAHRRGRVRTHSGLRDSGASFWDSYFGCKKTNAHRTSVHMIVCAESFKNVIISIQAFNPFFQVRKLLNVRLKWTWFSPWNKSLLTAFLFGKCSTFVDCPMFLLWKTRNGQHTNVNEAEVFGTWFETHVQCNATVL